MKALSPRRWSGSNKVSPLPSLWFGIGNLFIESLQQNDHRRVCRSFGSVTSRAQWRIATHRPGVDCGPENWEKNRKKKGWPGCPGSTSRVARMGWRAWELNFVWQDSQESPHLSIEGSPDLLKQIYISLDKLKL